MKSAAALVRYHGSPDSLRRAIELCDGFTGLTPNDRVLIKPNLVGYDERYPMPLFGIFTTTRIVEDLIVLLKEHGARSIAVAEGSVYVKGKDAGLTTHQIYDKLGYPLLAQRHDVELIDLMQQEFVTVEAEGWEFEVARPALEADFLINLPVLKTHNQSKVSLGLKNLKGCLSNKSRRNAHGADHSLLQRLSLFVERITPALTVIDGIFGLERGPYHGSIAKRVNALVASNDPLAADCVGAALAGLDPAEVSHLVDFAGRHGRSVALEAIELRGDPLDSLRQRLRWDTDWREDGSGPRVWDKLGLETAALPKYDDTLCTGCAYLYGPILLMLMSAALEGDAAATEVLTGKAMAPSGSAAHTVLVGQCMIKANARHEAIRHAVRIRGCPPSFDAVQKGLAECGIRVDLDAYRRLQGMVFQRYQGQPEFDPSFHYLTPRA